jgi:hypothetical protein
MQLVPARVLGVSVLLLYAVSLVVRGHRRGSGSPKLPIRKPPVLKTQQWAFSTVDFNFSMARLRLLALDR